MSLRSPIIFVSLLCVPFLTATPFARAASPGDPKCGDALDVSEVLVIDTEDDSPETAENLERIRSARMEEHVWPYKNRGSRVQTIRGAKQWAARYGCNVLVLGPMEERDMRSYGPSGTSDGRGGGAVELRKYLSLRVGVLGDG